MEAFRLKILPLEGSWVGSVLVTKGSGSGSGKHNGSGCASGSATLAETCKHSLVGTVRYAQYTAMIYLKVAIKTIGVIRLPSLPLKHAVNQGNAELQRCKEIMEKKNRTNPIWCADLSDECVMIKFKEKIDNNTLIQQCTAFRKIHTKITIWYGMPSKLLTNTIRTCVGYK